MFSYGDRPFHPFFFGILVGSLADRSNSLFSMMVIVLICISLTSASISTDSKNVQRSNYVSIFKEDGKLVLSKESWTHTFQIRLPVLASVKDIPTCTGSSFCHLIIHTMHYVHSLHMNMNAYSCESHCKVNSHPHSPNFF